MAPPPQPAPYTVRLDPDAARAAAAAGGALLLLGVPPGTVLGVDHQVCGGRVEGACGRRVPRAAAGRGAARARPPSFLPSLHLQSFTTGPKFAGVKMLPPGPHFVAYAAARGGAVAPAVWFFEWAAPGSVAVRRWCAASETLQPLEDEDEVERYAAGVARHDFDAGLAPYDIQGWGRWRSLTPHVFESSLARLVPGANQCVTAEADPGAGRALTVAEAGLEGALKKGRARSGAAGAPATAPPSATDSVVAPRWTPIPRRPDPTPGASPAAASAAHIDKSALLEATIRDRFGGDPNLLLAEFEIAFIAWFAGQSLGGVAAWKAILALALACAAAPAGALAPVYAELLIVLKAQLETGLGGGAGGDSPPASSLAAAADAALADSFLRRSWRDFVEGLDEAAGGVPAVLAGPLEELRRFLAARLGWVAGAGAVASLDSDGDSDGPVVVDAERGW